MEAEKLSISLPKDMARMVHQQVESGAYASTSEVIRDALRLWQERAQQRTERLDSIRAQLNEAAESPERISAHDMRRHFGQRFAEADEPKS